MYPANLQTPIRLNVAEFMDRLEDEFDILFRVQDLADDEEGYTDPQHREIIVDTAVYRGMLRGDGRSRMTCVHEVGHLQHIGQINRIIRHTSVPKLARRLNVTVPPYKDPERQATVVGGALLMPKSTLPVIYRRGGIAAIVDFYQVSGPAAEARVGHLTRKGWLR